MRNNNDQLTSKWGLYKILQRAGSNWTTALARTMLIGSLTVNLLYAQSLYRIHDGQRPFEELGVIDIIGDLDGDGYDDYFVFSQFAGGERTAYSGATGAAIWGPVGDPNVNLDGRFAQSIQDFDGDGVGDIAINFWHGTFPLRYLVHVVSGADGQLITEIDRPGLQGFATLAAFDGGDVNGDGFGDVLISSSPGLVSVYSGPSGTFLFDVIGGAQVPRASTLGDMNGDGKDEFAVGWYSEDLVRIYDGGTGNVYRTVFGAAAAGTGPPSCFGYRISSIGDIDGDAVPEFVIGAPEAFCNGNSDGFGYIRAYNGATLEMLWHVDGKLNYFLGAGGVVNSIGSQFGVFAEAGPDMSGDGIPDVLGYHAGGNDEITLLSGATGAALYHLDDARLTAITGTPDGSRGAYASIFGDLNGDGLVEFGFANPVYSFPGAMNAGRVYILSGGPGDAVPFCTAPINSTGRSGTLRTIGPITEGAPDLELEVSNATPNAFAALFFSLPDPNGATRPLGSGMLCLSTQGTGLYGRPTLLNGAGAGRFAVDWLDPSIQGMWMGGTTWILQAGFRDASDPFGANTTDALEILFTR